MRMRQSLAQFEVAFRAENEEDAIRREELRHVAAQRSRARRQQKVQKHGTLRFVGLVASIVATTVLVTIAMFETLARLIG